MQNNRFQEKCLDLYQDNNIISCKERENTLRFHCGGEQFYKIKIDGCEIVDQNTLKCDFMIVKRDEVLEVYVELKGSDIVHAAKQILATIRSKGKKRANKYAAIVPNCFPRGTDNDKISKMLSSENITPFLKNRELDLQYFRGEVIKRHN